MQDHLLEIMHMKLLCLRRLDRQASSRAQPTKVILYTLISLINVELGINVEGVQKLPNH